MTGFFTRRYFEIDEENKENYPICILCNGQHNEEMDFLIYMCLCKGCIMKMNPICNNCLTTNEVFQHSCLCMRPHRYNLTQFTWGN